MPTKRDRRKDQRVKVNWPVLIKDKEGVREGELRDVSLGGAFIRGGKPLNLRERSMLYIVVPNRRTFKVYFEVVWLRVDCSVGDHAPCGMGVRFTRVARPEREYLTGIISDHYQRKIAGGSRKRGQSPIHTHISPPVNQLPGGYFFILD